MQEVFYSNKTSDYEFVLEKIYSVNREKNKNLPKDKMNKKIDNSIIETIKKIIQSKEDPLSVVYINEPEIINLCVYKNKEYFFTISLQCQFEKNIVEIKIYDKNSQTKQPFFEIDDPLEKELYAFFL